LYESEVVPDDFIEADKLLEQLHELKVGRFSDGVIVKRHLSKPPGNLLDATLFLQCLHSAFASRLLCWYRHWVL
jgi:hypothetical protein